MVNEGNDISVLQHGVRKVNPVLDAHSTMSLRSVKERWVKFGKAGGEIPGQFPEETRFVVCDEG